VRYAIIGGRHDPSRASLPRDDKLVGCRLSCGSSLRRHSRRRRKSAVSVRRAVPVWNRLKRGCRRCPRMHADARGSLRVARRLLVPGRAKLESVPPLGMPLEASRAAVAKTRSFRLVAHGGPDGSRGHSRSCAAFASLAFSNYSHPARHPEPERTRARSARSRARPRSNARTATMACRVF